MTTPIYFYKTDSLSNLKPNSLIALKLTGGLDFSLWVTDKTGIPYPLKESVGGTITAIQNTDGKLVITGNETKTINVAPALLALINSALQAGDNVSDLTNDAGYLTTTDLSIVGITGSYNDLVDVPTTFAPSAHTHTISEVTNLQTSLNTKVDENAPIVGATHTKITYDDKGLVTGGVDATTADIADSTNRRYVTDADLIDINNLSGVNSGNQTSIVGITGTKSEFNTSLIDGNFLFVGDVSNTPDATTTSKGVIKLAGDLAGTADAPTVPGLANKVDKVAGKSLIDNTEITRLTTLSNYTHPTNHPPSIITQDASNRFVTDVEKTAWNAKQGALGFTPENIANKSDSYTTSSSTTYASTKALVEGLGTKQNTITNPVTGTFVAGRVPYSSSNSTLTDSSKLLWNNTNSSLEVNGNAPRLTLKNNLNNFSTYFTNDAYGDLYLKNHQDKILAVFSNPVNSTSQPQMAIGNVSSIPTESQLYVYGGKNGANIDARGSATVDECNIDLEGNDWTTSPNSLGFSYFGSSATAFGTMMGYAKNKLGVIRFQDTNYAIINSDKSTGISPIRFGINQIEIGNVNDKGFSYQSDFSSENISNPRWLTDKAYVDTKVPLSEKGAINGVATLGSDGKVPNSQIPALTTANISDSADKRYQTDNQKLFNDATSSIQMQINGKQNNLVSGTNIKTIKGLSLLGSGNIDLVKSSVGLSNVDNTSDLNKPISTATQTALNGKAPVSGSANYIQNQNASAQSANMWISGDVKARAGTFSSYVDVLGTVSGGNNFIANTGGLYFNGYNNYNAGIFSNTSGTGLSFQTGGDIALSLAPSGAATFSSTISATSYTGSATLTGTPTAPTAPVGTNTTQLATTAFVLANSSSGTGDTATFNYPQLTTAAVWTITHNLNNPFPAITVYNIDGEVIHPTKIKSITDDILEVTFPIVVAGYATLCANENPTIGPTYDVDADAFFTAVPTLNLTNKTAVNQLVLDLKSYSLWSKLLVVNPKAGSTASEHKWNLKDPRDLDIAYRYIYSGTWVHSALGALSNITNAFANTFLNPITAGLTGNISYGFYITQKATVFGDKHYMGIYTGSSNYISISNSTASNLVGTGYSTGTTPLVTDGNNNGFIALTLLGTVRTIYNKALKYTDTITGTAPANLNFYEGALNLNNAWYNGVDAKFGCSFIGQGLTNTEMDNLRTAITTYETALGRNV